MWSGDDLYFMKLALEEAQNAAWEEEVPNGAVLVLDGLLVGRGHNQCIRSHDPTAHAEIRALRDAGLWLKNYRIPGSCLYVTLEPCLMCFGALIQARIERVVFGASDPKVGLSHWQDSLPEGGLNHRLQFQGGLLESECRELLQTFFRQRRRK